MDEENKMSTISVIIPIYNSEKFLKECIDSIVNQSYKDLEIILVNDGSIDKSESICLEAAKTDNRIVYCYQSNAGVSSARNKGISLATGSYIMFLDSDDYVDKSICEKLIKGLESNHSEQAICGYVTKYFVEYKLKRSIVTVPGIGNLSDKKQIIKCYPELFNKKIALSPWMKLYVADIIFKNNIRFEEEIELGEDILFNFKYYMYVHKIATINEPLYIYRICKNRNSLTKKFSEERIENAAYILNASLEFSDNMGVANEDKAVFAKWYYKNCMLTMENLLRSQEKDKLKYEIKKILSSSATYKANRIKVKIDIEQCLYKACFMLNSYYLFLLIIYMRNIVKKVIRG